MHKGKKELARVEGNTIDTTGWGVFFVLADQAGGKTVYFI